MTATTPSPDRPTHETDARAPLRPDALDVPVDDDTLRETGFDTEALSARADELDGADDHDSMAERTTALRLLGRLDEAEACALRAVDAATSGGDVRAVARARMRLGQVLHHQSRFAEAEEEFAVALSDADQLGDERLRALALDRRGRCRYDEGRAEDAERDFSAVLQILRRGGGSDAEVLTAEQAVTAAMRRRLASAAGNSPG